MSDQNKQTSQESSQITDNNASPFADLKPAEIPTEIHIFSYQGEKKIRGKENK